MVQYINPIGLFPIRRLHKTLNYRRINKNEEYRMYIHFCFQTKKFGFIVENKSLYAQSGEQRISILDLQMQKRRG